MRQNSGLAHCIKSNRHWDYCGNYQEMVGLHLGDCFEIIPLIPDKSIDMILTDPPYEFISKDPIGGGFMKNENKKHLVNIKESFGMSFNPENFLNSIKRIMKKYNLYVFTNKNLLCKYIDFAESNDYKWDILVWLKPNPVPIFNGHYLIDKEYIVYIRETGATFNTNLNYNNYFTYYFHPVGGGSKDTKHPTEKQIGLITRFAMISSNIDDIVLDPFMGSGTTGVACKNLKRRFIGIEKDEKYFEIAKRRIENHKPQENLF